MQMGLSKNMKIDNIPSLQTNLEELISSSDSVNMFASYS
jgi:hypothetical protein